MQGSNLKVSDTLITPSQIIDSLLLSENLDWSVRLVSNFKQQQFRLSNEDSRLLYLPNNPFGVGFGIANQAGRIPVAVATSRDGRGTLYWRSYLPDQD